VRDHVEDLTIAQEELAGCLRSWRERLTPAEAGLPAGRGRRTPGLRREEVAQLAGVSLDYLARLEQGRAQSPSPSVLASLARALRLTDDERAHLFRSAGHLQPGPGTINRYITPSLQRLLDRLTDVPVMVVDPAGEVIAANPLANSLMGDLSGATRRERTFPWRHFTGIPSRLARTPEEHAEAEEAMAADLRDALGRFPDDQYLNELIRDLQELSPRFAELWEKRPVAHTPSRRKTFNHPEIGTITLDCDALAVQGSDLSVIVYTAPAGSPDAEALALLDAIGLQSF
jgi:transcriptional regulator with XRE-family HTH domain